VTGARQREARGFCRACPVRTECLAHALDQRIEFGVWGGMTERERRALLRSRPHVTSWAELLFAARRAHDAARSSDPEPLPPPRLASVPGQRPA
jgi:WhiB family transcriptional regulator, redox-sensing transcriptional regulator